jgi:hypothetical protein
MFCIEVWEIFLKFLNPRGAKYSRLRWLISFVPLSCAVALFITPILIATNKIRTGTQQVGPNCYISQVCFTMQNDLSILIQHEFLLFVNF